MAGVGKLTRASVAVGLVVAVLVLAAGGFAAWSRPESYTARASMLVLPETPAGQPDLVAGYYDTLSRGQVTATYAELLRDRRLLDSALEPLDLGADQRAAVDVGIEVVPDTSVIQVSATAGAARTAERVADAMGQAGVTYLTELDSPFTVRAAGAAADTAERAGLGRAPAFALTAALAAVLGLVVQQIVRYAGGVLRAQPRQGPDEDAPAVDDIDRLFDPAGFRPEPTVSRLPR